MLVLGISSSTAKHSVAVCEDNKVLGEIFVGTPFRHAEYLPKALSEVLLYAERKAAEVDVVGVDIGPGLYTGLRAGVAVAKAVCLALDKPVVPVPSLWALAYAGSRAVGEKLIAVVDARRKELFWQVCPPSVDELADALAAYVSDWGASTSEEEIGLRLGKEEDLLAELSELGPTAHQYALLGEGAVVFRGRALATASKAGHKDLLSFLEALRIIEVFKYPTASGVAECASLLANVEPSLLLAPENVGAIYMRGPDANRPSERRAEALVPSKIFFE